MERPWIWILETERAYISHKRIVWLLTSRCNNTSITLTTILALHWLFAMKFTYVFPFFSCGNQFIMRYQSSIQISSDTHVLKVHMKIVELNKIYKFLIFILIIYKPQPSAKDSDQKIKWGKYLQYVKRPKISSFYITNISRA